MSHALYIAQWIVGMIGLVGAVLFVLVMGHFMVEKSRQWREEDRKRGLRP